MKKVKFALLFVFLLGGGLVMFSCGTTGEDKEADETEENTSSGIAEIDEITQLIAEDGENAELYHQRATLYYGRGVIRESIRDWIKAIELDSINPEYHHRLSDALMDDNAPLRAIEVMEDIVDIYPERVPSLLKLGELYLIMGYYDEAIQAFNRVLIVEPKNPDALFMKGLTFRDQGDSVRAVRFLQAALEVDPSITDAYILIGQIFMEAGNELAERYFKNAIRLEPGNPTTHHALAEYYHMTDRLEEALVKYGEMHVSFPSYADAFYNSGLVYMEMNDLDSAYEMFNLALQIRPTMARGYYFRGLIYEERREYDRAIDQYDQAISLSPRYQRAIEALERVKYMKDKES
nr:tetratricopeptide repeat protein [Saprospiraceae bacterium]